MSIIHTRTCTHTDVCMYTYVFLYRVIPWYPGGLVPGPPPVPQADTKICGCLSPLHKMG